MSSEQEQDGITMLLAAAAFIQSTSPQKDNSIQSTEVESENTEANAETETSDRPAAAAAVEPQDGHNVSSTKFIGLGKTAVPKQLYATLRWDSYTAATRKLLMGVFSRKVLATHSLTGKSSPAFPDRPAKLRLDQRKVADIVMTVAKKCKVAENLVRSIITTKCADEHKMYKTRQAKANKKNKNDEKENESDNDCSNEQNIVCDRKKKTSHKNVAKKCKVAENLVRSVITTKCADEHKIYKARKAKATKKYKNDEKENESDNECTYEQNIVCDHKKQTSHKNEDVMVKINKKSKAQKRQKILHESSKSNTSQEEKVDLSHSPDGQELIGKGRTTVPKAVFEKMKWISYSTATRQLLIAVFPRIVLATHSLTGKASPAFPNKPPKAILDPVKVLDIVKTVAKKCNVKESLVRNAITIKCADENKMYRARKAKAKAKAKKNNGDHSYCLDKNDSDKSEL